MEIVDTEGWYNVETEVCDTLECLESLYRNSYPNQNIIVLDNRSTDGSVDAIRKSYPDVQIIELTENLGYAGNNNVGIQAALEQEADWVFVLNEDIILDSECISRLVEVGEADSGIGIIGPLVYHYNEPDVIQSAGGMLGKYWESIHLGKNETDQGQFNLPHPVEWISGCAILVRRRAVEQAGMLDKDYFIYWEETEWCIRVGRAGWKIINVPQARIWHKGGSIHCCSMRGRASSSRNSFPGWESGIGSRLWDSSLNQGQPSTVSEGTLSSWAMLHVMSWPRTAEAFPSQ